MSSQIGFLFATFVVQSFDCYTLFTKKPSLLKKFFLFLSCARFASDFLFSFQRPLSASFDADQHTGSLSRTFIVTERASAGNLVGSSGFEPPTLRLSGARSNHLSYEPVFPRAFTAFGGDEGNRTPDPLLAGQVLSQLSYTPLSAGTQNRITTILVSLFSS